MVKVKFFTQDMTDKLVLSSNDFYFDEVTVMVVHILSAKRLDLVRAAPNSRVVCLIENLEESES